MRYGKGTPWEKSALVSGAGSGQRVASNRRCRSSSSVPLSLILNSWGAVFVVMTEMLGAIAEGFVPRLLSNCRCVADIHALAPVAGDAASPPRLVRTGAGIPTPGKHSNDQDRYRAAPRSWLPRRGDARRRWRI